jgi:uncharacterized protein
VSVNDDRITGAGERATPAVATSAAPIADPAPLGAAAFALTTFLLSAANAGWMTKATGSAWLGYALAYGGLVQLLAAMWEFRNKNVFGTTLFGSYGGFWIGLGLFVLLVERNAPAAPALKAAYLAHTTKDLGWILLAFAIFNTYMLLISTQVNPTVFTVLLLLEATEILLFAAFFTGSSGTLKAGGYVGIATALAAWYLSAAGVTNGLGGRIKMPVGKPLIS